VAKPDILLQPGKPELFISCCLLQPLNNSRSPANSNLPYSLSLIHAAIGQRKLGIAFWDAESYMFGIPGTTLCPVDQMKGWVNFLREMITFISQSLSFENQ
jgi:hypothetical protein